MVCLEWNFEVHLWLLDRQHFFYVVVELEQRLRLLNRRVVVLVAVTADENRVVGCGWCFSLQAIWVMFFVALIFGVLNASLTTYLHWLRSWAMSSLEFTSMPVAWISRLHDSLNLRCGRPLGRVPLSSYPYSKSFGIRPGPSDDWHDLAISDAFQWA